MKKRWLCLCVVTIMLFALCACGGEEDNYDPTLFTQEYSTVDDFLSDYKNYYQPRYNSNIQNNESIVRFFKYSTYKLEFNQKLYDKFGALGMERLLNIVGNTTYKDVYTRVVKTGSQYTSLYILCNVLKKADFEEAIKVRLKNPESLQIHSVKMYAKEHIDDDSVFVVERFYVDYSAQNGFGGMNREWCSCDVSISYSDYSVTFSRKVETDDYTLRQDIAEATYVKTLF